jgi:phosphoribosylamine-glycine ligase
MQLMEDLNVPRPQTRVVNTPEEAMEAIKSATSPCILKATAVLDDLGRNDMTLYPLAGDSAPGYPATQRRLTSGLSIPISPSTPYIVQQFIAGAEFCTHATVVDNRLVAFVCCPSNDMLMRYEDCTSTVVGRKAQAWTETFLMAWAMSSRGRSEPLTGHVSMVRP